MKMGVRKPSLKKAVYTKVAASAYDIARETIKSKKKSKSKSKSKPRTSYAATNKPVQKKEQKPASPKTWRICGYIVKAVAVITALGFGLPALFDRVFVLLILAIIAAVAMWNLGSFWLKKANILEQYELADAKEALLKEQTKEDVVITETGKALEIEPEKETKSEEAL